MPYGSLLDWVYRDYNGYSLAPSLWTLPGAYMPADSIPPLLAREIGWLSFDERENDGKGFIEWQAYNHEDLGEIEIGGWIPFYRKNPPPGKWLETLCDKQVSAFISLGEMVPTLKILDVTVKPVQLLRGTAPAKISRKKDGTLRISSGKTTGDAMMIAEITIRVGNEGQLGTLSAIGQKTRYAQQPPRSVLADLESEEGNIEILSVPQTLRLGVLEGKETKEKVLEEAETEAGKKILDPAIARGSWLIKLTGRTANCTLNIRSEKGGTLRKSFKINLQI